MNPLAKPSPSPIPPGSRVRITFSDRPHLVGKTGRAGRSFTNRVATPDTVMVKLDDPLWEAAGFGSCFVSVPVRDVEVIAQ